MIKVLQLFTLNSIAPHQGLIFIAHGAWYRKYHTQMTPTYQYVLLNLAVSLNDQVTLHFMFSRKYTYTTFHPTISVLITTNSISVYTLLDNSFDNFIIYYDCLQFLRKNTRIGRYLLN